MLLSEAITAVTVEGGFDTTSTATSDATIRGWIHECVQDAVGRAKWRKSRVELGPTVAGQAQYPVPASVVGLRALRVGTSAPWSRVSTDELWEIEGGVRRLRAGTPGVFAPEFELDADAVISLYPVPTEGGLSILALAAVTAPAITAVTDPATDLGLPEDLVRPIVVEGPVGIGLERVMERPDLAAPHTARFESAVQELSRRANSRIGRGPVRVPIVRP